MEKTEQYINFSVPKETEVKRIEEGSANQKWKINYKNNILEITISWKRKVYGKFIIKSCK